LRARRHDEREERQRAVLGAIEEPLADAAAHAALGRSRLVLLRKPARVGEQLGETRLDRLARLLRGRGARDGGPDVRHESAYRTVSRTNSALIRAEHAILRSVEQRLT